MLHGGRGGPADAPFSGHFLRGAPGRGALRLPMPCPRDFIWYTEERWVGMPLSFVLPGSVGNLNCAYVVDRTTFRQ